MTINPHDISQMTPDPGIYCGISFPDYRAWSAVNWHTLWRLREESPAHAKYEMQHGTKETEALAFGALTDFVLLEPGRFEQEAVVEPEIGEGLAPRRPTQRQRDAKKPAPASVAAMEFWDQWDAENVGKIIVTREDYNRVLQIERSVRSAQCRDYICGGRSQVCVVWHDPVTGLPCKARLDYERSAGMNHIITDLKTSRSAKDDYWQWAIYKYGYFGQLAWYEWGWRVVTGESSLCGWLVAEKEGLCLVVHQEAHEQAMEAGTNAFRYALDRWAECERKQEWPGYPGGIINLAPWALAREGVGRDLIRVEPAPSPASDRDFAEAYGLE